MPSCQFATGSLAALILLYAEYVEKPLLPTSYKLAGADEETVRIKAYISAFIFHPKALYIERIQNHWPCQRN